jgi:integrase
MLTTIFRRHTATCPHKAKGRDHLKCSCPLWGDGYENGKRIFRQSLGTRDMARARKKAAALEASDTKLVKPVKDAKDAFLDYRRSQGYQDSTIRKYRNALNKLKDFCEARHIDYIGELTTDALDAFRAGRTLAQITSLKELEMLRSFCGFCCDRKWAPENVAKKIKGPRNIKPNDVVPYTTSEVQKIIAATDAFGRGPYERTRAYTMILLFRYTALRISDVALFSRERISRDGSRWRVFLRTQKNGQPVFLSVPLELKRALDSLPAPRGAEKDCLNYFWNGKGTTKSIISMVDRTLRAVFKKSGVSGAHAHRFRHTLATELLGKGASFEDIADVLGNSPEIARKHYAKWSPARQQRIDALMSKVHSNAEYVTTDVIQ